MSITDRIRKQLDQPDALTMEAIEPLAESYGQETQQANARLSECIQLLRKGLRSEAIQRASMKPNLLDWCARLDFPEIDDWFEILKFYGISVPPLLDRAAAQQLQEAIVDEQPLEELLRQHRQLAIGKAPLSWRLKVLRRLAQIDSVNSVWREDQEQWEIIRLKQIPSELNRAIDAGTLSEIQDLSAELNRSSWVVTPPKELCKQAASAANSLIYKDQLARLHRLIDKLHAAYSEGDETAAEKHYDTYNAHIAQMISPPSTEVTSRAEPAIEWLTECIQAREKVQLFELNSAALENLLQGTPTLADLERAYYDVASLQMGIDPILEQRYETKTAQLRQQSRRRLQMYFVGVAAATITLLVALGFWQWNRTRRQAINETVAKLQGFIDSQDYVAAEGVVKQLATDDSAVAKSPEVIVVVEDLKSKQAAENERRQRTEALIASTEREDPSTIDINQVMLAEKEARTPEEVIRIKRVRANWESYEKSLSEVHASSIKKSVTNLDSKLLAIEQLPLDEINDAEIDAVVIELNKLPVEFPKALNKDSLLKPALDRATAIKENARKRRSEIALRQRLTFGVRSAVSLSAFISEMKDYADKLPGDKLAKLFSDALVEQALWQHLDDWNRWCDSVITSAGDGLSADELASLSSRLNSLKTKLSGLPVNNIADDLGQLSGEADARKVALKSLTEQFSVGSSPENVNQLAQLVTLIEPGKTGKRRFMNFQARQANALAISKLGDFSKISLPVVIDDALQSEEVDFKGKVTIYEEPRATVRRLGEHFQEKKFLENWDVQMTTAMRIIRDDKNLDSMLKEFLLEAVIKSAGDGSKFLKESLAPTLKKLGDTREKRNLWFVPATPDFQLAPDVDASLKQGVQQARAAQAAFMGRLGQATKVRFTWVGAILRDNSDKLEGWLSKTDIADGQLFTILAAPNSRDKGQLTRVGLIQSKRVILNAPPENLLVGRPLFWLPNPKPVTAGTSAQSSVK